jgi:TonB family protein
MSHYLASNLLALALQAALLVAVGAPLPRLLGIWSPRARMLYWRGLMLACLALPFLQPWIPDPVLAVIPSAADLPLALSVTVDTSAGPVLAELPTGSGGHPSGATIVLALLAAGVLLRVRWLSAGIGALHRLRREALLLQPEPPAVDEARLLTGADAEFRVGAEGTSPVTFGVFRPVVVVPPDFEAFDPDKQRAVACHELLHVRRLDWLRSVGDELVRAVAWFHPAAWWLTSQIRLSREQVVDLDVIRLTGTRRSYLEALLHLAASVRRAELVPAPLFLGRTHLRQRVALLAKEISMSRTRLVASFVVMGFIVGGMGAVATRALPLKVMATPAAVRGDVPLPPAQAGGGTAKTTAKLLRGAPAVFPAGSGGHVLLLVSLAPTGNVADVEVVEGTTGLAGPAVDAVKRWVFTSPVTTPYSFYIGFNTAADRTGVGAQPPVIVGGQVKAPTRVKDVKPVYPKEAIAAKAQGVVILETVIDPAGRVAEARCVRDVPGLTIAAIEAVLQWQFAPMGFPVRMTVTVNFTLDDGPKAPGVGQGVSGGVRGGVSKGVTGGVTGGAVQGGIVEGAAGAVRVGGNIKAPTKTLDVKPVYPEEAQSARIQGVVIAELLIAPDGKVTDAKILRSIPQLDQAALDAVRQWQFTPTVVDGKAVPVVMTVTINFVLE